MTAIVKRYVWEALAELLPEAKKAGVDLTDTEALLDWSYGDPDEDAEDDGWVGDPLPGPNSKEFERRFSVVRRVQGWLETQGGREGYPRGLEEGFRGVDHYWVVMYGKMGPGGWVEIASRLDEFGEDSPVLFSSEGGCLEWMRHAVNYHPETGEAISGGLSPAFSINELVTELLDGDEDAAVILDPDQDGGGETIRIGDLLENSETEVLKP